MSGRRKGKSVVKKRFYGKSDRLLQVIILARKRYKNDEDFVQAVNDILHHEGLVHRDEFGELEDKDED